MGKQKVAHPELNPAEVSELHGMSKPQLETKCIYLMRKRMALEVAINTNQTSITNLQKSIGIRGRQLDECTKKFADSQKLMQQTIERLNAEQQGHLERIVELQKENTELKNKIGNNG